MNLYEIVIQHKPVVAYGFLRGFILGRNNEEALYRGEDYNISSAHLKQDIADKLGLHGRYSTFVIEESVLGPLTEAIQLVESDLGISLHKVHGISGLSFDFEVEIFNRDIGKEVLALIENRDDAIQLKGFEPEEKVEKDAAGAELYAPEHEYELTGSGHAEGPFEKIIEFYSALSDIDQVDCSDMALQVVEE